MAKRKVQQQQQEQKQEQGALALIEKEDKQDKVLSAEEMAQFQRELEEANNSSLSPDPDLERLLHQMETEGGETTEAEAEKPEYLKAPDPLLLAILETPRRHDSPTEQEFLKWLVEQLRGHAERQKGELLEHALKCFSVSIPMPSGSASSTLFSCHIDTIDPAQETKQKTLVYCEDFHTIKLAKDSSGSSLGADDGVGVWIMLKMIEAGVPGTYLFHRGEEMGCLGSRKLAELEGPWLAQFQLAVAFDRPNAHEVITHQQGGQQCASDKTADALCAALNEHQFDYVKSAKGVVTDTAMYKFLIPECFNLGVGYMSQHSRDEELDYEHAYRLMQAAIKIKWEKLPIDRDAKKAKEAHEKAFSQRSYQPSYGREWQSTGRGGQGYYANREFGGKTPVSSPASAPQQSKSPSFSLGKRSSPHMLPDDYQDTLDALDEMSREEIRESLDTDVEFGYQAVEALLLERDALQSQVLRLQRLLGI